MHPLQTIFKLAPKGPALGHTLLAYKVETPRFQGIVRKDAAGLLSRFVEEGLQMGFPFRLQVPGWLPARMREIGAMQALDRLEQGLPVEFQPQRLVAFGLSPEKLLNLFHTARVGVPLTMPDMGATPPEPTQPEPTGWQLNLGGAMVVSDFAELKILYELFTPWRWEAKRGSTENVALQLSRFTTAYHTSACPWTIHEGAAESLRIRPGQVAWHIVSGGLQAAGWGALCGAGILLAAMAARVALPVDMWTVLAGGAATLMGHHWVQSLWRVFREKTGLPLSPLVALDRLTDGQSVWFQRREAWGIPVLKGVARYGVRGRPNLVRGTEGLFSLYLMHTPSTMTRKAGGEGSATPS